MRKKIKDKNQEKLQEQRNIEEENKKKKEQRELKKKKQSDLTSNLKKTYGHIRPTIIQAQRILKVIESLLSKMEFLYPMTSSLTQSVKTDELNTMGLDTKKLMIAMAEQEVVLFELKHELVIQENLYLAMKEEERELNEESESRQEVNEEHEELLRETKSKQLKIVEQAQKMKKLVRLAIRHFEKEVNDFTMLKQLSNKYPGESVMKDAYDCIQSLYFLFMKKLSTGFDEEESHKMLLQNLYSNVKDNTQLLEAKEKELNQIKNERKEENERLNTEINSLKNQLMTMKEDEKAKTRDLLDESQKVKEINKQEHEERKQKLTEAIEKIKKELDDIEKKNLEEESNQTKQNDDISKRLENLISEYDNTNTQFNNEYNTLKVN